MLVTLNIKGPPRVVLLTPYPDDPKGAVQLFRREFRAAIQDKSILMPEVETRSWHQLCDALAGLPSTHQGYNCLLILTHGTKNHRLAFQDPDFPLPSSLDQVEFLGDLVKWSNFFRSAFDDKLLMFAACHSGDSMNTNPLLHTGMALHVVAPEPSNPSLKAATGAKAMALYLDLLAGKNKSELSPDDLEHVEAEVNIRHHNTLKLWPYEADPAFVEHMDRELQKWWAEEGGK